LRSSMMMPTNPSLFSIASSFVNTNKNPDTVPQFPATASGFFHCSTLGVRAVGPLPQEIIFHYIK